MFGKNPLLQVFVYILSLYRYYQLCMDFHSAFGQNRKGVSVLP